MNTIELNELAAKIAVELRALGETCHNVVTEHNPQIHFTGGEGRYIWLREDKGRLQVHGNQTFKDAKGSPTFLKAYSPEGKDIDCPSIGVSVTKTPKQIANDIQKRFLPGYEVYYAAVIQRLKASRDYDKAIAANRATFERVTGDKISQHQQENDFTLKTFVGAETHRLEVRTSDKTCEIKICGITVEQATKVIEFLKGL